MTMIRPRSDVVYGICRGLPSGTFRLNSIEKGAINIINIFFALTCKTCKAHNYISINVTLKLYGYQNFLPSVSCFHDDSASDSTI